MSAPTFTDAQKAATLIENRVIQLQSQVGTQVKQLTGIITNGIPPSPSGGAVSSEDLASALGSNLTTVQSVLAALAAAVPAV